MQRDLRSDDRCLTVRHDRDHVPIHSVMTAARLRAGRSARRPAPSRRFSASCAITTRDAACCTWSTKRTSRSPNARLQRIVDEAREQWPSVDAGHPSSDRHARDRRSQRRHRRRLAAPRRRLRRLPLRHRAHQADRADLEARVLRGRRRVDRGRDRRSGRRGGARGRDEDRVRVTVRLFARLRDLVGAGELRARRAGGATVATVWDGLVRDYPAIAPYAESMSCAVNIDYARMTTAGAATATRWRFCRRSRAVERTRMYECKHAR